MYSKHQQQHLPLLQSSIAHQYDVETPTLTSTRCSSEQRPSTGVRTPERKRLQSSHPFSVRACQTTHHRRSWKDQQGVGRRDLKNEMGHHTLPIKNVHPYSIKQAHRTRSSTTIAGAPEPYSNWLRNV